MPYRHVHLYITFMLMVSLLLPIAGYGGSQSQLTFGDFQYLFVDSRVCYFVITETGENGKPIPGAVHDNLAAAYVAAIPGGWNASVVVIVDSNEYFVSQEPPYEPRNFEYDSSLILFGGPVSNALTYYYMSLNYPEGSPPVIVWADDTAVHFTRTDTGEELLSVSFDDISRNMGKSDLFLIEVFEDHEGRPVMICLGVTAYGTYAGGWYFRNVIYGNSLFDGYSYLIVNWTDNLEYGRYPGVPDDWDYWAPLWDVSG